MRDITNHILGSLFQRIRCFGISIRLGYADTEFRECQKCEGAEKYGTAEKCISCGKETKLIRKVSFVDAPGHETLMATMLSGAALMHGAILVIAANEKCPQPQTEEHLMAASIMGIKKIVVVQNKIDLVGKEEAVQNYKEIEAFLKQYGYGDSEIIPIAAHFGTNIDMLIESLVKNIEPPKFDAKKPLKMFAARSFDINKPGAKPVELKGGVLGGSIIQGELKIGDEIEIKPGVDGKTIVTKVADLSTADGHIGRAIPGGLIGVGTLLDPGLTRNDQMKGQVIGKPGSLPDATAKLNLEVFPIKRIVDNKTTNVIINDILILTVGTMAALGTATKKLKKQEFEITLKNPVVIDKEQRVAISKKEGGRWRLVAYGVAK